ncbi:MAG: TetR family transcriptional regulator, partial [Ramlibacter sp.]|nr:TetR family transcriptional regulator [Cryobacterium sp.]
ASPTTFSTYSRGKSALPGAAADAGLAGPPAAPAECADAAGTAEAVAAVEWALLQISAGFGPGHVPWALTQSELMDTTGELEASALSRFMAQVSLVDRFVAARTRTLTGTGHEAEVACRSFAMAVLAAAAAAAGVWARAGVSRGPLGPYVGAAIAPVCSGYRAAHAAG